MAKHRDDVEIIKLIKILIFINSMHHIFKVLNIMLNLKINTEVKRMFTWAKSDQLGGRLIGT
jgi:hypothetical protein